MNKTADDYYAALQPEYAVKIRQLVPAYDDMVECIRDAVRRAAPRSILDIGAGVGDVTTLILADIPQAALTAVEASAHMAAAAARILATFGNRATLIQGDILTFAPEHTFDAAYTNLVLHNLTLPDKRRLLGTLATWLEPGGIFVWGDLIRYRDAGSQEHFLTYRREFASSHGCAEDLIEWNFAKELDDDHPLTVDETVRLLADTGFANGRVVWMHDLFAVFLARPDA